MKPLVYISQKVDSIAKLLRCAIAAVEIAGNGVDLTARFVHETNSLPSFLLAVKLSLIHI